MLTQKEASTHQPDYKSQTVVSQQYKQVTMNDKKNWLKKILIMIPNYNPSIQIELYQEGSILPTARAMNFKYFRKEF